MLYFINIANDWQHTTLFRLQRGGGNLIFTKNLMKSLMCLAAATFLSACIHAQQAWTVDDCMAFAVENNREVRQARLTLDSYAALHRQAKVAFTPALSGSVGAQTSFGRSVDPATNTYDNVSNFNNAYSLAFSLPLFNGGALINGLKTAKANRLMGKTALRETEDNVMLEVFAAFIDVAYYGKMVTMSEAKLDESETTLKQTRKMFELGLKGQADVAQLEAQVAGDRWNVTHQRNLHEGAVLTLKQKMNYPFGDTLVLDTSCPVPQPVPGTASGEIVDYALANNATVRKAYYSALAADHEAKAAFGRLLPTLTVNGGYATNYFKSLDGGQFPNWKSQMTNNRGTYIGVTLSVPLFSRLSGLTSLRVARNDRRIANEQYAAGREELEKLVLQAIMDRDAYRRETLQMQEKVAADSIAYGITRRKFEEGLMSPIDLKTAAATLLESRANLERSRLTLVMKCKLVDFYSGTPLIGNKD